MLGELGSVVEADGFAHCLWKLAELTADGAGGEGGFAIDRLADDTEAGLSFVQNQQALAISGEQHEVGFPVARDLAAFDFGGPFSEGPAVFDEARGAAASLPAAPASEFVTR